MKPEYFLHNHSRTRKRKQRVTASQESREKEREHDMSEKAAMQTLNTREYHSSMASQKYIKPSHHYHPSDPSFHKQNPHSPYISHLVISSVLTRPPIPKGTVPFGSSNVPFGSVSKMPSTPNPANIYRKSLAVIGNIKGTSFPWPTTRYRHYCISLSMATQDYYCMVGNLCIRQHLAIQHIADLFINFNKRLLCHLLVFPHRYRLTTPTKYLTRV